MAKSIRSKVKRSFRAKKRETGKYAAAEAARLNRLNTKLAAVKEGNRDEDIPLDDAEGVEAEGHPEGSWDSEKLVTVLGGMVLDGADEKSMRISTHGSRGSRREEWRKSKGMEPVPKRHGMNRQGGLAARRKAGRPSRRR
ncbi:hypothetical protein PAXINDRAFT_107532 [Paxillus involutus ATCC 200175]|nr:hypothetical protein PAXINDRAFT_107532 [Paxillus involutus ATCC 200175]